MATVGSVYAKAVFELTEGKGGAEPVVQQLREFWDAVKSHDALRAVLTGPVAEAGKRKAILGDLAGALGLKGVCGNLLELLAARGRLGSVPEIIAQLEAMIEASQGVQVGRVRSAVELSADEVAVLAASLAKKVGGRVRLSQEVDSSLLGGVVATVAGRTFDASLRTQIERFKNELI